MNYWRSCRDMCNIVPVAPNAPDDKSNILQTAKAYLPGFCITMWKDHHSQSTHGAMHVELAGDYHA